MEHYFGFMASKEGRLLRILVGIAIMIVTFFVLPSSYLLWGIGMLVVLLAAINVSLFAPLFGYPLMGAGAEKKSAPGRRPEQTPKNSEGRPQYHAGSTTQGGSDYGQGSMQLGRDSYKQGSEKNEGSNYGNERGKE